MSNAIPLSFCTDLFIATEKDKLYNSVLEKHFDLKERSIRAI
jgi:hypothetical protein